ncbi:toxin ParE1/3/4 [Lachnospiraceae bacterium PF1-21]|uniref:Type II toxin-antitoxin system RelE/ParE family toxin n=1 Tax=Ohessyouella blattaphilus TaxID=2949333 RepID=A0ABT1EJ02_9FIRM|nr:type II toxin-antitoxin system RelE/ParE family toxin [Ohessyouella blattaphilus]MCP1109666.1 type II toxin-antitoxin system RelE/ParE family toxin [Ohessyouella blattaphilus]MCR8563060.1 type II toxin-antitoxin system RelE/ParE family toxin [Ohessyouella blattaphilus]
MNYYIHITAAAERDMERSADYIEFVLKNPQAADNLLDEAERQINALTQFPEKFALVDDKLLASWGIRFTKVDNYLAFYIIAEEEQQIYVIRFLYGKSNWASILKISRKV